MKEKNNRGINKTFNDFLGIIDALRSPEGCPWDREQTPVTLRPHLIEESYEAVEAIDEGDADHVREELGDVLLLIAMISRIYSETGNFDFKDVIDEVSAKLIRRHPHVFGDEKVNDAEEVLRNWDRIKKDVEGRKVSSVLDGIPGSLPPLERSYKMQKKASKKGFDWPDINGPRDKISEEIREIEEALEDGETSDIELELGDLLFSVVNYARHLDIDPSLALSRSNRKFESRFKQVEKHMMEDGIPMSPENIEIMDRYWDSAKKEILSRN